MVHRAEAKGDGAALCRIAFLNVMDGYSGGEIVLKRLIEGIDRGVFDPVVFTRESRFVKMLKCDGCRVVTIPRQYQLKLRRGPGALFSILGNFLVSGKYVRDMKYRYRVDIIHSNSLTSSIYFAFWAKLFGVGFVAHNHLIREGKIYSVLYRYIGWCSDRVVCVSEAVKRCWLEAGVPEDKLTVVYNGLPDDFFQH
ncbi:hypothetical protein NNO_2094 [Hydrogenimonas sp.]|nr:hypothetical protein NNO_2094 [Hydrogenimonas sp.]